MHRLVLENERRLFSLILQDEDTRAACGRLSILVLYFAEGAFMGAFTTCDRVDDEAPAHDGAARHGGGAGAAKERGLGGVEARAAGTSFRR
jgi:hypothetical protein